MSRSRPLLPCDRSSATGVYEVRRSSSGVPSVCLFSSGACIDIRSTFVHVRFCRPFTCVLNQMNILSIVPDRVRFRVRVLAIFCRVRTAIVADSCLFYTWSMHPVIVLVDVRSHSFESPDVSEILHYPYYRRTHQILCSVPCYSFSSECKMR